MNWIDALNHPPRRVVCLSAEAADWLWRVGAWDRVVGVTAFFKLPEGAAGKPRVSGFSTADLEQVAKLRPDLVVTFSDVQAPLAAELVRRGLCVLATNQRNLDEVVETLSLLARIMGKERKAARLLAEFRQRLLPVEHQNSNRGVSAKHHEERPRVYFEEWNDPMIAAIAWVSELVERARGIDIFPELRAKRSARERVVSSEEVRSRQPQVILASWCGKPVRQSEIVTRPGWNDLPAVRDGHVYEIAGQDILQPGFRLIRGYEQIKQHLRKARSGLRTRAESL